MKLHTLLTAALVLVSTSAFAETLGLMLPAAVSLEEARETFLDHADVQLSERRIDDAHGVRRFDDKDFQTSVPVLIGERYVLRDATGGEHVLRVRNVISGQMFIDLKPVNTPDSTRRMAKPGRFQLKTYAVNDANLPAVYPELVLHADGTFQMGATKGTWKQANQALSLDGYYAQWGAGALSEGGEKIVFEFTRGEAEVKAVLERVTDHGNTTVAAAR